MKSRNDFWLRGLMIVLLVALAWSLWAGAQTVTNQSASASINRTSTLVTEVERLDRSYLSFGLNRIEFLREHSLFGEALWKYPASLIFILLTFAAARVIDLAAFAWLKKLAARTETKLDDLLLEMLRGPIKLVAFVIFLHLGLAIFDWPAPAKLYFSRGLILIVACSLTYLTIKIVNLALELWRRRSAGEEDRKFNDQLFAIIRKSLNVFIVIVAVLVTAQNIGINITAAITSLSIGGLAVGLAAQDTLANLFGAVAVFADKPFRVGDKIKVADTEGVVESVGLRSTRVRNPDGHVVAIPNKIMGNAAIINISQRPNIKTVINLVLAHDLPSAKVKRAVALLEEIYRAHPMTQEAWVSFNQFAGRNLNVLIVHWSKSADSRKNLDAMQELNLEVKERFDAEGITLA